MPVIDVESMVTRAGLRYTRINLTPGIISQIKDAGMKKKDVISSQIPFSHVIIEHTKRSIFVLASL